MRTRLIWFFVLCFSLATHAQNKERINWINFEQLEDSLATRPKKVFISFHADWCAYCKKMDKATFKNPAVVSQLNSNYYAVKMDAESTDTIIFGGQSFSNTEVGKKRNPTHQIPLLLASRADEPFTLPAMLLLDEGFKVKQRYFEYLSPKELERILSKL